MTPAVRVTACPICGARRFASLPAPVRTIGGPLGARRDLGLARCRACGFELVDPRPSDDDLAAFYADRDYTAHEPVDDRAAQRRAAGQLAAIAAAGVEVRGAAVLDVGCGGGQWLAAARARGAVPCGVDVAEHAQAACRRQAIEVAASLDDLRGRTFDGALMSHVLEHVPDLRATLRDLHALLADRGWLCLEVPNIASLRARLSRPTIVRLGADEKYRAFPIHLSYFAPSTLRSLLAATGFDVIAMTTAGLGIDALIPRPEPVAVSVSVSVSVPVSEPVPVPVSVPVSVSEPVSVSVSARRALKRLYFGALLGENLIAIARRRAT